MSEAVLFSTTFSFTIELSLYHIVLFRKSPLLITMRFTTETVLSLLLAVGSVSAKSFHHMAIHRRSGGSFVGCFSSKGSLGDSTTYTFQSTGWCSDHCSGKSASVYAMTGGSDCLCGDSTPPSSDKVSNSKCDTDCQGFPDDKCMLMLKPREYSFCFTNSKSTYRWW